MNELIKVTEKEGQQLVSARDLWEFLEIKEQFQDWFKRILEFGFEENIDFTSFSEKSEKGGRPRKEYILKIDMAKELSMLARNEKGKQARKYFIECENKLRNIVHSYQIEDPIKRAKAWIKEQEEKQKLIEENKAKEQVILEYTPKIEYVDKILNDTDNLLTITQIAKDYDLSGVSLNNILHEEKVQYKQNKTWLLYTKHASKGYTKSVTVEKNGKSLLHTKWTQKGRLFIHEILKSKDILAIEDITN